MSVQLLQRLDQLRADCPHWLEERFIEGGSNGEIVIGTIHNRAQLQTKVVALIVLATALGCAIAWVIWALPTRYDDFSDGGSTLRVLYQWNWFPLILYVVLAILLLINPIWRAWGHERLHVGAGLLEVQRCFGPVRWKERYDAGYLEIVTHLDGAQQVGSMGLGLRGSGGKHSGILLAPFDAPIEGLLYVAEFLAEQTGFRVVREEVPYSSGG